MLQLLDPDRYNQKILAKMSQKCGSLRFHLLLSGQVVEPAGRQTAIDLECHGTHVVSL